MPMMAPFRYEGESTREISFPLGGIGTGSIGLSGAGRLIDWEIQNRPAKGITNGLSHFAVRAEQDGKVLDARILNGPYLGNRTFAGVPRLGLGGAYHASPHFKRAYFSLPRFDLAALVRPSAWLSFELGLTGGYVLDGRFNNH